MKRCLPLVLILVCVAGYAQQPAALESNYDRFKGVTTINSPYEYIRFDTNNRNIRSVQMKLIASFKGSALRDQVQKFTVGFYFMSHEWQFRPRNESSLIILCDDKKVLDGSASLIDSSVQAGYAIEIYAAEVDRELLQQMSRAKAVALQIGTVELALTPANQSTLAEILKRTQP